MKTLLLVTVDEATRGRIQRRLEGYSVFAAPSDDEALKALRLTAVDLVVKDATPPVRDLQVFVGKARQLCPSAVFVCLHQGDDVTEEERESLEAADFLLRKPFSADDLALVLRQAEDKRRLILEVEALRSPEAVSAGARGDSAELGGAELSPEALGRAVREFAKVLSANFDRSHVLNRFLDAVNELARPSRAALLMAGPDGAIYRVEANRGLPGHVVESVRLSAEDGLPRWLSIQGRILFAEELRGQQRDPTAVEIQREMAILQAAVAIPLMAHGALAGILTLGQRVTGAAYSHREAETLFTLGAHLASAAGDIARHHQLREQKIYIERILSHLSSGVITIDRRERVTVMNRRAEEILKLSAAEILSRDLRALPSPLGDLLYETMSRGRSVDRAEVQLALRKLPLEVSTYPIAGDGPEPLGAVMVFEDLSARKELAEEKRRAEQRELLTRIIARIADEIKNPLVSISTFMELIGERYEDAEFRQKFSTVVGRDVKRLTQVFERLVALVGESEYKFEPVDVGAVVEKCLVGLGAVPELPAANGGRLLRLTDEATSRQITVAVYHEADPLHVRGDRAQLIGAFIYLIRYLIKKARDQEVKISVSVGRHRTSAGGDNVRVVISSRTAAVTDAEIERIFDPLAAIQEQLFDVGPCVSQRIVEALGGRLEAARGKHEVSFTASLPESRA